MSFAVRVLGRPELASGFALAGLRPIEAPTVEKGVERLRDVIAQPEIGVVLLEQEVYDRLPHDLRRLLGRRPLPMVVPFPVPARGERADAAEAYIVELLRQVIGYRVRLR